MKLLRHVIVILACLILLAGIISCGEPVEEDSSDSGNNTSLQGSWVGEFTVIHSSSGTYNSFIYMRIEQNGSTLSGTYGSNSCTGIIAGSVSAGGISINHASALCGDSGSATAIRSQNASTALLTFDGKGTDQSGTYIFTGTLEMLSSSNNE